MTSEEICRILQERFGDAVTSVMLETARPYAVVTAERWPAVARYLCDDSQMKFNMLRSISAIDLLADDKLGCVYDLLSIPMAVGDAVVPARHTFAVRVVTERSNPHIPSVADVWPAADWHEREAFDLMGIIFDGHPRLERILCAEDWEGHPLRKDYVFPLEYHGIPGTTEYELTNPRH
jgi:NADH-quinone oxidoreductase subunit C